MRKMKLSIVEDEPLSAQRLINCINLWEKNVHIKVEQYICTSVRGVLLDKLLASNIVFLDIKLKDTLNGIDLAKQLRTLHYSGEIVFLTAYHEYVLEGYRVHAMDYLLKPVMLTDVERCLSTVSDKLKSEYYLLQNQQVVMKMPYYDILYFSSDKHYVDIICTDQTYHQLAALKNIIPTLPSQFLQCHRTVVLNIQHIYCINKNDITMSNGDVLPVSKTYLQQIRHAFINAILP